MNDDDDRLIFEFDDDMSMDELLGEERVEPAVAPQKRKTPRRAMPGPLDMEFGDSMDELFSAQDQPQQPAEPREMPGLPQDLFEDVQADSMDDLIRGGKSSSGEVLTGWIKEVSLEGARVSLGDGREGRISKTEFEDWAAADLGDEVLVERSPDDPGPVYQLRLLKHDASRKSRSTSAPTERAKPSVRFRPGDGFVIDGSNVTRSFVASGDSPSLAPLLTLVLALAEHGGRCCCVFDANEQYVLDGVSARTYVGLLSNHSRVFIEAPGGSNADDYILKIAHRERLAVISNDRFDKRADGHRREYTWLVPGGSRLISGDAGNGLLEIPRLGIKVPLRSDIDAMVNELRSCNVAL